MLDPEFTNALVLMRKGKTVDRLGVCKASRIKVEAEILNLSPLDPSSKMFSRDLITVYFFTAELPVTGMKIQTLFTGDQCESLF